MTAEPPDRDDHEQDRTHDGDSGGRRRWALAVVSAVAGFMLGVVAVVDEQARTAGTAPSQQSARSGSASAGTNGDSSDDPADTAASEAARARADIEQQRADAQAMSERAARQLADAAAREQAIDEREAQVTAREEQVQAELASAAARIERTQRAIEADEPVDLIVTDGLYAVGVDLVAGTYRATGTGGFCYVAVFDDMTGDLGTLRSVHYGNANGRRVTVSDGQFLEVETCGEWLLEAPDDTAQADDE